MKKVNKSNKLQKGISPDEFPVVEETISRKYFDNKTIYTSDNIRIINFQCDCHESFTSQTELSGYFCIGFTRKGNFRFQSFRHSADLYNSRILIEKPECEYRLTHNGNEANATTFFIFSKEFYEELKEKYSDQCLFFKSDNILSLLLTVSPGLEYLHYSIWKKIKRKDNCKLEIDSMVIELVNMVIESIAYGTYPDEVPELLRKNHLTTIERAKEFILENFTKNISLSDLAKYCYVSPFHFSRTFKQFNLFSPYRYLQDLRLKNAEMLLKSTTLSITDVCFMSGFNSLDYFSTAFSKKYKLSPSKYRLAVCP